MMINLRQVAHTAILDHVEESDRAHAWRKLPLQQWFDQKT
jgi:hypothetical protein